MFWSPREGCRWVTGTCSGTDGSSFGSFLLLKVMSGFFCPQASPQGRPWSRVAFWSGGHEAGKADDLCDPDDRGRVKETGAGPARKSGLGHRHGPTLRPAGVPEDERSAQTLWCQDQSKGSFGNKGKNGFYYDMFRNGGDERGKYTVVSGNAHFGQTNTIGQVEISFYLPSLFFGTSFLPASLSYI